MLSITDALTLGCFTFAKIFNIGINYISKKIFIGIAVFALQTRTLRFKDEVCLSCVLPLDFSVPCSIWDCIFDPRYFIHDFPVFCPWASHCTSLGLSEG